MCRVIKLNGNMTSDLNKGITSITYNHLNLPVEVVYAGENAVRYRYIAGDTWGRLSIGVDSTFLMFFCR